MASILSGSDLEEAVKWMELTPECMTTQLCGKQSNLFQMNTTEFIEAIAL